jgi:hypothetical protein
VRPSPHGGEVGKGTPAPCGRLLEEPADVASHAGEKGGHERLSKNPQALLACQVGWPRAVQRMRRHALDDTLGLKLGKDRKMSVGGGVDPLWDVPDEGSLKDLAEPRGEYGVGKPPEDQADGEPAGAAPLVLKLAIAL